MNIQKAAQDSLSKAQRVECPKCGEALVRVNATGDAAKDFIEVSSRQEHGCWKALPENAEHLRTND